jgi:type IV pilus assembly protein PilA
MNRHLSIRHKGKKGFTLIEVLIVVAVIGIIVAMMIPNLLDALQKAKQKKSIADMRIVGTAMFSWLTDQAGAAAAGTAASPLPVQLAQVDLTTYGTQHPASSLVTVLVTQYIEAIPELDGWQTPYHYYLRTDNPSANHVMAIRSLGRKRVSEGNTYTFGEFDPTDYDRDIVWADGYFIRAPAKH